MLAVRTLTAAGGDSFMFIDACAMLLAGWQARSAYRLARSKHKHIMPTGVGARITNINTSFSRSRATRCMHRDAREDFKRFIFLGA